MNNWERPEIDQNDPRVKNIRAKALEFLKKSGMEEDLLKRYPIAVMLPDGDESWCEAVVFIGYNDVKITDIRTPQSGLPGVILTFTTNLDDVERVTKRQISVGKDKPVIDGRDKFSPIPINSLANLSHDGWAGTLSDSTLFSNSYRLLGNKPYNSHQISGFYMYVSNEFCNKTLPYQQRFGKNVFVVTKTSPLKK